jgi:outer membrane protein
MKQIKFLVASLILVFGAQNATAQSKMAHVDTAEIMSKLPAMLDVQKQMQTLGKSYQDTYTTLTSELDAKFKKYDAEAATAGDKVNEERAKEVQEMKKRVAEYGENAQKDMEKKQAELTNPVVEKVKASIKKVAKAKGVQYVLNAEGLLVADGPDLTADVKKDLGITTP